MGWRNFGDRLVGRAHRCLLRTQRILSQSTVCEGDHWAFVMNKNDAGRWTMKPGIGYATFCSWGS
jgi:hypothetical protein